MEMQKEIEELLILVKQKKELAGISKEVVLESITSYLKKMNLSSEKIIKMSEKERKLIVKEIRMNLRLLHGRFNHSGKKRSKLVEEENYQGLLMTHTSTKERLDYYEDIKRLISSLDITSILDLGCGLNPIALSDKKYSYYYLDINEEELSIVDDYFKKNNFKGNSIVSDIRKVNVERLPHADLCIIFKVLDILKNDKYNVTRNIFKNISCKYFLVSFATKTLSGKKMNNKNRFWFESIIKEFNYKYELKEFDNEVIYLVFRN